MTKTITTIGPADHGRPMALDEFAEAEGQEGRVYELGRGKVIVVEIPKKRHTLQVAATRDQLQVYKVSPPRIYRSKLLPGLEFSIASVFKAAGLV